MRMAISSGEELPDDPGHPLTLGHALLRAAERFPRAGLHVIPGRFDTYPELLEKARRVLNGLGRHDTEYAVLRVSDEDYFPVFWGCVLAGVVPVTTGPPPTYEQDNPALQAIRHTWNRLGRPLVIASESDVDNLRHALGGDVADAGVLLRHAPIPADPVARPDDVAFLQLSSGSTGTPKIIKISHRGVSQYAVGAHRQLGIGEGDILFNWLPLDHVAGLMLYHLGGVFLGATTVQAPTAPILADPLRWLDLLEEYSVTHAWAPNFAYRLVADAIAGAGSRSWDLSRIKRLVSGGEQCTRETFEAFVEATKSFGVTAHAMTPGWGMSETCTGITFCSFDDPGCVRGEYLSVGRPAPGATLRIVDSDGRLLPEGTAGRLQVRSARVTPGYVGDEFALVDGEWLDTGDLAYMLDGAITITGREKDLVIINGHNHPCHEIERVVHDIDGVTDRLVAACGIPSDRSGTEQLVVFYATSTPSERTRAEIVAAIGEKLRLPVADVVPVPPSDFPRTSGGKIQRSALRERYLARRRPVRRIVLEAVASFVDGSDVDAVKPLYELGLGSVQMVQLRSRLESELGRAVSEATLFAHPTVDALAAHLTASPESAATEPDSARASVADRRVAIIGMAARLPGARTVDEFWSNLLAGVESVRFFPSDEEGVVAASGVLDDVAAFDAGFFGISAKEAELMDPQHRLFLETCYHALEHSGYAGTPSPGVQIGLYAGSGMNLYTHHTYLRNNLAAAADSSDPATTIGAALGNQPDFLATRVAYRLGLTGPAVNVQTACSTSLVAVHLAVQSLMTGDADIALAGAAAVHIPQETGYRYSPDSILSPDGHCRPFDAAAAGTVGGNGVAAVVLKPLAKAQADGDTIHAVILGTAINNDGAGKVGFTAPGMAGQVEVIRAALRNGGVSPESVGYIEAHGTGTALGDPIEFEALSKAYPSGPRYLGSVKANLGHLDSCAGMAGLLKAVLVVREGRIPPQLNFERPHPALDLSASGFRVATAAVDWLTSPRRAAISALGVGGTNAHVVIEQPPAAPAPSAHDAPDLLPLSAASPEALQELIASHKGLTGPDALFTAALGRRHRRHRAVLTGQTVITGVASPEGIGPIAFGFPGQGTEPQRALARLAHFPQIAELWQGRYAGSSTEAVQPALVTLGLGLAALWRSWGVDPGYVIGHSVGEITALAVAGALSPADAIRLAEIRGRLMQELMPPGAMAAVFTERSTVDDLLAEVPELELAAVNGPSQFVVAGPPAAIAKARDLGAPMRELATERAFHTAAVEPILAELRSALSAITFRPIRVPVLSTVDGQMRPVGWVPDADYLCEQARRPVLFDAAVAALAATDSTVVIEAGPDAVLTGLAPPSPRWIPSQPLWQAVAELYCAGADLDWAGLVGPVGQRIPLPPYPFERTRYWIEPASTPDPLPAETGLLDRVRAMTAASLGTKAAEIGPDDSFLSLGADSLLLVSMSREVEREFGARIPVRDLFGEVCTPRRLAQSLTEALAAKLPPEPAATATPAVLPAAANTALDEQAGARQPALEPRAATVPQPAQGLQPIIEQQLEIMRRQLDLLSAASPPPSDQAAATPPPRHQQTAPSTYTPATQTPAGDTDISLYFFGDYPESTDPGKYQLILEAAEFADRNGLHAVWVPERHFHSFGGLFPNPSVLAAAIAARTERIRINAGSVVLPLHHPIRVAEEWSMIDNISGGRVGIGCAPGWHANDFVFFPEHYGKHKQVMYEHLEQVRRLWRGEAIAATSGSREEIEVRLYPRPVQEIPPMFTAIVGNPDSYRDAARHDLGVVTNLMTQDVAQLARNIALYRQTRAEHGLDPAAGRVVVLLHTYLGPDDKATRQAAFEPFCSYLKSSFSLLGQVANSLGMNIDLKNTPDDDLRFILGRAYERYCSERALIGTPQKCQKVFQAVLDAGADEISCFIDFGLPPDAVRAGLPFLRQLRGIADETAPLSAAQRRLWTAEKLRPGQPAYNEAAATRLDGPLDIAALQGALADVVARHTPLRTVYRDDRQVILPHIAVECPVVDCGGQDEAEAVGRAMSEESHRRFDLAGGPVFAFRLLRFAETRHVLVTCFHHLAADGRSYAVFTQDVSRFYQARKGVDAAPPPLPLTYAEYARGQRPDPELREADLAYWRERLSQPPPNLSLPSDLTRPAAPTAAGRSVFFDLPAAPVSRFGRAHSLTPFTTLISAFAWSLARMCGQSDFVIGTGVTNRDEQTADLMGFFVDTVPLRFQVEPGQGFAQWATRVQADAVAAYGHTSVPFDEIVDELAPRRESGRNPYFDIAVEYESGGAFDFDLPGVTATPLKAGLDKAPVDLMVYLSYGDTVRCHVEYRSEVLDEPTVQRLFDCFGRVLEQVTADPALPLEQLTLAGSVAAGASTPAARELLHELVLRQAERRPEALAVVAGDLRWTYGQLCERAERVRDDLDIAPGELVAVVLPRGPELVAAQLGVMLAGGGFVPIDPDTPDARLRELLRDSGARSAIVAEGVVPQTHPARRLELPAWCLYTSGSTGRPKGVVVSHRAAVNSILWHVRYLQLSTADRVTHGMALGFDANLAEIYPALAAGATLYPVPDAVRLDPSAQVAWWERHDISVAFLPAPVAELVFERQGKVTPRILVVGGSQLRHRPPVGFGAQVVNAYGPTENAIVTTAGIVSPDATDRIDIGRPIDNVTVEIVDPGGVPVPPGAVGELRVSGRNLSDGYLDEPMPGTGYRTRDLGRLRADGTIEFLGRTDDQVKIAGHRVEPGEVTAVLASLDGVSQAAVVARHDRGSEPYLTAYVVGADRRDQLARRVPAHMIPKAWVFLPALPLTSAGKVDVAALPAPPPLEAIAAPDGDREREIHAAWCAELQVDALPLDVTFFQAGGNSLAAMRVANRLDLPVHAVLEAPGIRALASSLHVRDVAPATFRDVAPATFQQEQMWRRVTRTQNHASAHIALRMDLTGRLDLPALTEALNALAQRHPTLRSRLVERDGEVLQEVLDHRPITCCVSDVDAEQLDQWCVRQGRVPFDPPPMLRADVARVCDERWVVLLVVHHLAIDGWSMLLLTQELAEFYRATVEARPPVLAPLGISYAEFARGQRAKGIDRGVLDFWRSRLAGAPRKLELPTDRPRPATTMEGAEYGFTIPAPLTASLHRLAQKLNTSMYPVLAAGYATLMARRTGLDDIVVSSPHAGRVRRELEQVVGMFNSNLQLRLRPSVGFAELVRAADKGMLEALRHQPYYASVLFAELDPDWRPGQPPPLGDALFAWNPGMPDLQLPGLTARLTDQPLACARKDIATIVAPEGDHLRGAVEYSTDLFDESTIAGLCAEFVDILHDAAASGRTG